ncbi:hypothetical protein ACWDYJ_30840 [Streptomyces sp. NPDC003042]
MTEPQTDTAPVPAAAPAQPARTGSRKKAVALTAAGLAVVVLAGGGVWASSALADADRSAPTAYWTAAGAELPKPEEAAPVPANALTGKLLPLPDGYAPGPDLAEDGNNFFVSGEKAVESMKEARRGLSSSDRKKRDDVLAELKLKGMAGRSYVAGGGRMIAEVSITQADPKALEMFSKVSRKLLEFIGDDREAPKVDGFPDAKCSLTEIGEEKDAKIDSITCVAVEGDVMVEFRAYGPKPGFSASDAAGFLKNQLSHLKSPGESA